MLYVAHNNSAVLYDFAPSRQLAPSDFADPQLMGRLVEVLHTLHSLAVPSTLPPSQPLVDVSFFLSRMANPDEWCSLFERAPALADPPRDVDPGPERFIHDDVHPGNVRHGDERLVLVDWAASRRGSIYCDLAMVAIQIPPPAVAQMVKLDFRNAVPDSAARTLKFFIGHRVVRLMAWSLAMAQNLAPGRCFRPTDLGGNGGMDAVDASRVAAALASESPLVTADDYFDFARLGYQIVFCARPLIAGIDV